MIKYIKYNKNHRTDKYITKSSGVYDNRSMLIFVEKDLYYLDPKTLFCSEYSDFCINMDDLYEDMKEEFLKHYFSFLDRLNRMNPIYFDLISDKKLLMSREIYDQDSKEIKGRKVYISDSYFKTTNLIEGLKGNTETKLRSLNNTESFKKIIKPINKSKNSNTKFYNKSIRNTESIDIYNKKTKKIDINIIKNSKMIKISQKDFSIDIFNDVRNNIKLITKKVRNLNIEKFFKIDSNKLPDKTNIDTKDLLNKNNKVYLNDHEEIIIISEKFMYSKIKDEFYIKGISKSFMVIFDKNYYMREPQNLFKTLIEIAKYQNHKELKDEYADFINIYTNILKNYKNIKDDIFKKYKSNDYLTLIENSKLFEIKLLDYTNQYFHLQKDTDFELNNKSCKYVCENLLRNTRPKYWIYNTISPIDNQNNMYLQNIRFDGDNPIIRYQNKSYILTSGFKSSSRAFRPTETIYDDFIKDFS